MKTPQVTAESEILAFALEYLKNGFSVIPVKGIHYANPEDVARDSKVPLIAWVEFQKRLPTEKEVIQWFRRWPLANIGIVTGKVSGIVVVDFDSPDSVFWAEEQGLLETRLVRTTRGFHAYYRYPERSEVCSAVNINGMKIDIRGNGGYVIAPPSLHSSGTRYVWVNEHELLPLPDAFFMRVRTKKVIDLRPFYGGVEAGLRNDTLARLCGSWVNDGLSFEECLEMAHLWNEKNNPPLPAAEVERTVKSIFRRHTLRSTTETRYFHEKNLLRLPFFTHGKEYIHKPVEIKVRSETKRERKEWSVVPSMRFGLPGPFDEAVFMAISRIISEKPRPITNPVDIGSLRNVAKVMKQDGSGKTLKLIKESIQRLKSTVVLSEAVFYDAERKRFVSDTFSFFDRVIFQGEIINGVERAKSTYIWLNSVLLKNINAGYICQINYDLYFSLKTYLARGLYRIFSPVICSGSVPIRVSYKNIVRKLCIKEERFLADIKQQLRKAHVELIEAGIFKKVEFQSSNSGVLIIYQRG